MRITLCLAAIAALFCGCSTQPKTYKAPDGAKLKAAQAALNVKAAKARATAAKSRAAVLAAQDVAKRLIAMSDTVRDGLSLLHTKVTPDLYPLLEAIQKEAADQRAAEEELRERLAEAVAWNTQLFAELQDVEKARQLVQIEADKYQVSAVGLAQDATNERNYRITAEKQLMKEKWTRILWRIGGGAFLLLILVIVGLWLTGKLGVFAGKIAAKF